MISFKNFKNLWFIMHHSDDSRRQSMTLRCYLDESGTHPGSMYAVVGGLIMTKDDSLMLSAVWESLLSRHRIEPPLHMREFGPHGRHKDLNYDERTELFNDLSILINCYKHDSIVGYLSHDKFEKIISNEIRNHIGVYGMCFMLVSQLCYIHEPYYNIAFFMEEGNEYAEHIRKCHAKQIEIQKDGVLPIRPGSLSFESKSLPWLQAADIIAWGFNRLINGRGLGKGFQPIAEIFKIRHIQHSWNDDYLQTFNDELMKSW